MLFCIRLTNFIQMRPLTVEIWRVTTYLDSWLRYNYFRFLKRSPYRNSTSGFDFDHSTAIGMLFCIMLPNFIQIWPPTVEIWRHIYFSRWQPLPLNTTSSFLFVDVTAFRMAKSISKPNFVHISQLSAVTELLAFRKKRPPCSNSTFGFDVGYSTAIGMLFCIMLPNFIQIGQPTAEIWRHIHFSRWRPLLLNTTSGFVFVDVTALRRAKSISKSNFISYLNWRLRCNYFRFWKTNVRHIGILLPVLISTSSP